MRVILLSFFSLFLLQCSVADPTASWFENAPGTYTLTAVGSEWLNTTVGLGESATSEGDAVTIYSSGQFAVGEDLFSFVEIESTGMFAIYSVLIDESAKYIALGFNNDYDILFVATVYTSSDSTVTATTGDTLLKK